MPEEVKTGMEEVPKDRKKNKKDKKGKRTAEARKSSLQGLFQYHRQLMDSRDSEGLHRSLSLLEMRPFHSNTM